LGRDTRVHHQERNYIFSYTLMPLGIARDQFEISAINGDRSVNSGKAGIFLAGFEKHE
jgi:hypothetical protein